MVDALGETNLVCDALAQFSSVCWPQLDNVFCPQIGQTNIIVLAAGFEDRSLVALQRLKKTGVTGFDLLIIEYLPEYEQNQSDKIREIAGEMSGNVTVLVYNTQDPAGFGEKIKSHCISYSRVLLDISGMSRLLIVQAIVALLGISHVDLSLVYSQADVYPPSRDVVESDEQTDGIKVNLGYLSSGVFEVATTPELGSLAMPGEPIRLIAFPSFDPAQLANLVQELQPTYIDLIHGIPPNPSLQWRIEAVKRLNSSVLKHRELKDQYYASTLHYSHTLDVLLAIYRATSATNRLVLAPTGSKMQAVAVGIFRTVFRDIQIVYPTPQVFSRPEEYTKGVQQVYQLEFPRRLLAWLTD